MSSAGGSDAAVSGCAAELLDVVPAVMRTIRQHMRRASSAELSVPQFRTLRFLDRRRGCSLSELAEHIGLSLPSASKLVQLLLGRGYVHRQIDPTDRRRTVLAPTPKGKRLIKSARQEAGRFLAQQISGLDDENRLTVIRAMQLLRGTFSPELNDDDSIEAPEMMVPRHRRAQGSSV